MSLTSDIGCEYKLICKTYTGNNSECSPSTCQEYQFKQIQYGNQNAEGWVYGEHVKVIRSKDSFVTPKSTKKKDIKTSCFNLYSNIKRLIEIYNEESAQLTSKYNLRPYHALHRFDIHR